MPPHILAVILARAGSKGLPNKNILLLAGRPIIAYSIEQAQCPSLVDAVCVTTDAPAAAEVARAEGVFVVDRPPELATDTATVDAAVRHAVEAYERTGPRVTHVAILYANVPVRATGVIDRTLRHLLDTGADSVRTLAPVSKQHPDWLHRLDGDRMIQFRKNSIYRRQDLEPLYYHDGAVLAVTRRALFTVSPEDHHAFLGADRRGIVGRADDTVDIDSPDDFQLAEAMIHSRESMTESACSRTGTGSRRDGQDRATSVERQPPTGRHLLHAGHPHPRPADAVCIGGRWIGPGEPVYVIAEVGVNHNGDVDTAHRLVDAARQAGADAVKFQMFSADRLVSASAPPCEYQQRHDARATSQRDLLRRLELPLAAFAELKKHAERVGLHFLATPFGLDELRFILDLGVPAIKIASPDLVNVPLLTAAARTGLPLIVSTGASTLDEVDAAVQIIRTGRRSPTTEPDQPAVQAKHPTTRDSPTAEHRGPSADQPSCAVGRPDAAIAELPESSPTDAGLILLHCVSAYPTDPARTRLSCIGTLARRYNIPVGFSDHTAEASFSVVAVAAGAVILEKHFTLDRGASGPDHFFSLLPDQLAAYVQAARLARSALGDEPFAPSPVETEVRKLARGGIVTVVPIAAGLTVTPEMLAVQRPADGISPACWHAVVGRIARTDIPAHTRLTWNMLA